MRLFDLDTEKIYFPSIKEYYEEILSSYSTGHYRSAIVMLYAAMESDLMQKLNELDTRYNDTKAHEILEDINKKRNNKPRPNLEWENDLLDKSYNETNILTIQEFQNVNHLKDDRNLSAHPSFNNNYELLSISQESTIAHIKNMYSIFIKPPYFTKEPTILLVETLKEKKNIYESDYEKLKYFLNESFLSLFTDEILLKVFKKLWYFVFKFVTDKDCIDNFTILRKSLDIVYEKNPTIVISGIRKEPQYFNEIDLSDETLKNLIFFLARHQDVYDLLGEEIKESINALINRHGMFEYKFISWFSSPTKKDYLSQLSIPFGYSALSKNIVSFCDNQYSLSGFYSDLKDYYLKLYEASDSFDDSNDKYINIIKPHFNDFTLDDFERIIKSINENGQHTYLAWRQNPHNREIKNFIDNKFGKTAINYSLYPRFKID